MPAPTDELHPVNFFCRIFGHTWVPRTEDASTVWNTTKKGMVLMPTSDEGTRYFDACQRCGERRDVQLGREFPDRPDDVVDEGRVKGHLG